MVWLVLALLLVGILGWTLRAALFTGWRRARIRARPFPHAWREILRHHVPYFRCLPSDLQLQLKKHIQVFIAEKPFVGCDGIEVTDEMRVTIAAQACLLLLNRRSDYFPDLTQILVYPGRFIVDREVADGPGLARQERRVLSGESWSRGRVILSWDDVLEDAAHPDGGRNVAIHEFAHQLDQEDGAANGAPFMRGRARRARWAAVLGAEFHTLRERVLNGEPSLIDEYGATNPAEFFAVVSEVFFGRPRELAAEHPRLYAEFSRYYRVNPLSW